MNEVDAKHPYSGADEVASHLSFLIPQPPLLFKEGKYRVALPPATSPGGR